MLAVLRQTRWSPSEVLRMSHGEWCYRHTSASCSRDAAALMILLMVLTHACRVSWNQRRNKSLTDAVTPIVCWRHHRVQPLAPQDIGTLSGNSTPARDGIRSAKHSAKTGLRYTSPSGSDLYTLAGSAEDFIQRKYRLKPVAKRSLRKQTTKWADLRLRRSFWSHEKGLTGEARRPAFAETERTSDGGSATGLLQPSRRVFALPRQQRTRLCRRARSSKHGLNRLA